MLNFPPHISYGELIHSQTASRLEIDNTPPDEEKVNLVRVAWFLETLRSGLTDKYGFVCPLTISSGYRCLELNTIIGGSKTSAHTSGLAADISCPYVSPYDIALYIERHMVDTGFDQVIYEFGEWVHIGLGSIMNRYESLTAIRENNKTVYKNGILKIGE